jgi:hypothetical protein
MVMQIPTENSVGKSKDCGSEWKYTEAQKISYNEETRFLRVISSSSLVWYRTFFSFFFLVSQIFFH